MDFKSIHLFGFGLDLDWIFQIQSMTTPTNIKHGSVACGSVATILGLPSQIAYGGRPKNLPHHPPQQPSCSI